MIIKHKKFKKENHINKIKGKKQQPIIKEEEKRVT
jgi:hypothetical protein